MKQFILCSLLAIFTITFSFGQNSSTSPTIIDRVEIESIDGVQTVRLNNNLGSLTIVIERQQITSISRTLNGRNYPLQEVADCPLPNAPSCWKDNNQNLIISDGGSAGIGRDVIVSRDDKDKE